MSSIRQRYTCSVLCRRPDGYRLPIISTCQLPVKFVHSIAVQLCIWRSVMNYFKVGWLDSLVSKVPDWWLTDRGFTPRPPRCRVTTLGQFVHTHVVLSPSSITWYRRDVVGPHPWSRSVSWFLAEGLQKWRSSPGSWAHLVWGGFYVLLG